MLRIHAEALGATRVCLAKRADVQITTSASGFASVRRRDIIAVANSRVVAASRKTVMGWHGTSCAPETTYADAGSVSGDPADT